MTSKTIVPRFTYLKQAPKRWLARNGHNERPVRPHLHQLACDEARLPRFVQESALAMRYLRLLALLAWDQFPERDLQRNYGKPAVPYAPFVAACLVRLDQGLIYMHRLRQYLVDHPALVWVLGFPLVPSRQFPWGFDVEASLPTHRHFTRMLRTLPNAILQGLLDSTVAQLQAAGCPVAVVNARRIREFARACGLLAKTDKLDAQVIARFAAQQYMQSRLYRGLSDQDPE